MHFSDGTGRDAARIVALFTEVFAASEGAGEGALIGGLADRLIDSTPAEDIFTFRAEDGETLAGAIIFTRLRYAIPVSAFVLGPVAVATGRQGQGVGRGLIAHGLGALRAAGVEVALTYGDPAFYTRVGFQPIAETAVPAPYRLQMPEGWLGQSLTGAPLATLPGPCTCVPGFADPAFW